MEEGAGKSWRGDGGFHGQVGGEGKMQDRQGLAGGAHESDLHVRRSGDMILHQEVSFLN